MKLTICQDIFILEYMNDQLIDEKIAKKCLVLADRLLDENQIYSIPLLIKADKINPKLNFDARKLFSSGKATYRYIKAAILVKNAFQRFLGELYIKANKPKMVTQIFKCQREAMKWLTVSS